MIIELKVNGKTFKADLEKELKITDVNKDMDVVASKMAYWASINANAEAEKITTDTYYRRWRAEIGKKILSKDPKMSEWKVKQEIENDVHFETLKTGLSIAVRNVALARGVYESLKTKASMLQSKGAMMRAEIDYTDMSTPEKDPVKKLRKINETKSKKSKK